MSRRTLVIVVLILCVLTLIISAVLYFMSKSSMSNGIAPTISEPQEQSSDVTTKVYFSKIPESYDTDFAFGVAVSRVISKSSPVEDSLNMLFKGPTVSEVAGGLRDPIPLSGESNCDGNDFRIVSNSTQLGSDIEVHFCKDITISGVGDVARIQSVIKKTLLALQDSANFKVGRIAVLDKSNNCLGDESGMNACIH
ncbi:MAG: hypothetical protein ACMG57_02555 [Candidatus Dojkabacteria bacterium]